jgi:hypothetical protein
MFQPLHPDSADAETARWAPLRRAPREGDATLTGPARQWLRRLPARRRPLRLCESYPRVANRIAWCWSDPVLAEQALDDLLTDRRGGRAGFPALVVRELQRLRHFNDQHRVDAAVGSSWAAVGPLVGLN